MPESAGVGGFRVLYESSDGVPFTVEGSQRVDAHGVPYTHHRVLMAEGRTGAVTLGWRDGRVVLVRSVRPSAGKELWELPRGVGDVADEDGVETGLRELLEETGYCGYSAAQIACFVIDSSVYPQPVAVVTCDVSEGAAQATDGEAEESSWFTPAEVGEMIRQGIIADALTLAAWAAWQAQKVL